MADSETFISGNIKFTQYCFDTSPNQIGVFRSETLEYPIIEYIMTLYDHAVELTTEEEYSRSFINRINLRKHTIIEKY